MRFQVNKKRFGAASALLVIGILSFGLTSITWHETDARPCQRLDASETAIRECVVKKARGIESNLLALGGIVIGAISLTAGLVLAARSTTRAPIITGENSEVEKEGRKAKSVWQ
jgi:hypothetical protein